MASRRGGVMGGVRCGCFLFSSWSLLPLALSSAGSLALGHVGDLVPVSGRVVLPFYSVFPVFSLFECGKKVVKDSKR